MAGVCWLDVYVGGEPVFVLCYQHVVGWQLSFVTSLDGESEAGGFLEACLELFNFLFFCCFHEDVVDITAVDVRFLCFLKTSFSMLPKKKFASSMPNREPIATPSIG